LYVRPSRNKFTSIPARNAQNRIRYFPSTHALSQRAVVCIIELPFKRYLQRRSCDDAFVPLTQRFAAPLFEATAGRVCVLYDASCCVWRWGLALSSNKAWSCNSECAKSIRKCSRCSQKCQLEHQYCLQYRYTRRHIPENLNLKRLFFSSHPLLGLSWHFTGYILQYFYFVPPQPPPPPKARALPNQNLFYIPILIVCVLGYMEYRTFSFRFSWNSVWKFYIKIDEYNEFLFISKLDLNLRKKESKMLRLKYSFCMVLKIGQYGR
jgi:hypothetical protein